MNQISKIKRSILYGTVAKPLVEKQGDHTHTWKVYVKGFHNEDISKYVKRVVFKLHESIPDSTRSIEKAPFEVNETGWGEFQIEIRIFFQDPAQKQLNLMHHLKLYEIYQNTSDPDPLKPIKSVISEKYEEIIFDPPTTSMLKILTSNDQIIFQNIKSSPNFKELEENEKYQLESIQKHIDKVKKLIE